jgi:hypothetical protein
VKRLSILLPLVLLMSCISTKAVLLDPTATSYDVVPPSEVRIFTEEAELESLEYIKVAMIEATGNSGWTNQSKMIEKMREKAGKMGANAILMPQIAEPGSGAKVAGAIFGVGAERKGNVMAIRVIGPKKEE